MVHLATLSVVAAASFVAVLAGGSAHWPPEACPKDFQLELVETESKHHVWARQCLCVNNWNPWVTIDIPLEWPCRAEPVENHWGQWECKTTCPPPPPNQSHKPGKPSWKREQLRLPDGTPVICPLDAASCPMDDHEGEIECIQWKEDLYNCGGCTNLGHGVNCLKLPAVKGTSCVEAKCEIYSCASGFTLVSSQNGSRECVKEAHSRRAYHDIADSL